MKDKRILWLTADYFIDVDRHIVPCLRNDYNLNIDWIILQSFNTTKLQVHKDYKIIELHYKGKDPRLFFEYRKLFNNIKLESFDVIYSDALGFLYYLAMLSCVDDKRKILHAAHNVNPYPVWPLGLKIQVKFIFNKLENFQMFSRHTAQWFYKHYPQKSFFYAPMIIKDYGSIQTNNYIVDKTKVNLLFFGNVVANKRLDLLIDAVKNLPENIQKRVHLNICGNCTKMNADDFIQQIGDCHAISSYFKRIPDEDIPELFSKHQFLMLTYCDVAQSGPHMIAYNYNLPVIASDIDGFSERVIDNENGFLFKVNDKLSLIDCITKAVELSDFEYNEMKRNLSDYVCDNFDLKTVSMKYISYLKKMI